MNTTSFRRRAAAVATGTLAAGALSFVPAIAGISTASAATAEIDYTCQAAFPASFSSYNGAYSATVEYALGEIESLAVGETVNPDVTATLTFGDDLGAKLKPSPVNKFTQSTGVLDTTAPTAGTAALTFTEWVRGGGMGSDMPPMTMTGTGSWGSVTATEPGALEFRAGDLTGALKMGTTFGSTLYDWTVDCAPTEGGDVLVRTVDVASDEEPEPFGNASCEIDMTASGFGGKDTYDVEITHAITAPATATVGKAFTPSLSTSLKFGQPFVDYMVTSPTKTIGVVADVATTAGGTAGTASVDLGEWNRTWTTPTPIGSPIEAIELSGTGSFGPITPTAAGTLPLSATGLDGDISMTVSFGDMKSTYPLDCTMNDGAAPATASVVVEKAPVVSPAATKTTVKTAYAKKAKKLTAKVTVTANKGKPAGKATLVLKKGNKQVGTATVNVKKGSAKAVFKKIAKGNYKLTVTYAGNKSFKASKKTVTVKVK